MDTVGTAWKRLDGSYRLSARFPADADEWTRRYFDGLRDAIRRAGGRWDGEAGAWVVPESAVDRLGAERIFVVVAAGYCCRGPSRAEVRAHQWRRGVILRVFCESCGKRPSGPTLWEIPILDVCGEGEEGQITYETAFRASIEG